MLPKYFKIASLLFKKDYAHSQKLRNHLAGGAEENQTGNSASNQSVASATC